MVKNAFWTLLAVGFVAFVVWATQPVVYPRRTLRVEHMLAPVVSRTVGTHWASITVYYLLAADGSRVEVSMPFYSRTHIGQTVTSTGWRLPAEQTNDN